MCVGGEQPPEPGYVKAKLTIGVEDNGWKGILYGFSLDGIGSLEPQMGYSFLQYKYTEFGGESAIFCTRPFYYLDQKYTGGGLTSAKPGTPSDWMSMSGQTVDVWLAPE